MADFRLLEKPRERISVWAKQLLSRLDDVDSGPDMSDNITHFNSLINTESGMVSVAS